MYLGLFVVTILTGAIKSNKRGEKRMTIEELKLSDEQITGVNKLIQSAEDRIRTDYAKRLKDVNDELAKYKPVEKSEAEKALEKRIASLEAREREIADKERSMTIANKLKDKGLPSELAQFLNVGDDVDKTVESVGAALGSYFLDGSNKPGNHTTNRSITKQDFKRMSYSERAKLFAENPQLYQALNK
jgi:hypothetical protein